MINNVRIILKYLGFVLIFLVFMVTTAHPAKADLADSLGIPVHSESPTDYDLAPCEKFALPTPTPSNTDTETIDDNGTDADFVTNPPLESIDERVPCVNVTFHGIGDGTSSLYYLCTGDDACLKPGKVDSDNVKKREPSVSNGTDVTFTICGDGEDELFVNQKCTVGDSITPGPNNNYKPRLEEKHYFFGGHLYSFSVAKKNGDSYFSLKPGGFFVSRSYPTVKIQPSSNLTTQSNISVTVLNDAWRGAGDTGGWARNNYKIVMEGGEGGSYKELLCAGFNDRNNPSINTNFSGFSKGTYTIAIQDETDDSGKSLGHIWSTNPTRFNPINFYGSAREQASNATSNVYSQYANLISWCKGGFTYYKITCTILDPSDPANKDKSGSCTDPEKSKDPNGDEYKAFLSAINELNRAGKINSLPCGTGNTGKILRSKTNCPYVDTAIGRIEVGTPQRFILYIFRFALTIAGFGGVVLILVSGYIMMISSGDKEKVQGAREMITSAIVGLLFIILSIVILEVIGVDILKLPGFGK